MYEIELAPEANEDLSHIQMIEPADGQRFVLAAIEGWEGFKVGDDDDITGNEQLMARLANRRSGGQRIPLAQAKSQLGL